MAVVALPPFKNVRCVWSMAHDTITPRQKEGASKRNHAKEKQSKLNIIFARSVWISKPYY